MNRQARSRQTCQSQVRALTLVSCHMPREVVENVRCFFILTRTDGLLTIRSIDLEFFVIAVAMSVLMNAKTYK